jgi:hypothetical protein
LACFNRDRHGKVGMADVFDTTDYQTRLISDVEEFMGVNSHNIYTQYHPDERKRCKHHGLVPFTIQDQDKLLGMELCANSLDHVGRTTQAMASAVEVAVEPATAPTTCVPLPSEHVPVLMPGKTTRSCSMCRDRKALLGLKATDRGGNTVTRYMCKICNVVMHDTQEDRVEHMKMVHENDPKLGMLNKYDPNKKGGHHKGKTNKGGRPRGSSQGVGRKK